MKNRYINFDQLSFCSTKYFEKRLRQALDLYFNFIKLFCFQINPAGTAMITVNAIF